MLRWNLFLTLIFEIENWLWRYNFGTFWQTVIHQRIFKEKNPLSMLNVDFWAKMLLVRTHHLWNSTTELTLSMCTVYLYIGMYIVCTMWRRPTEYGIQLHSSEDLGLTRWTAFQWCWKLNKHLSRREQVTNDIGLHNFMNSIAMLLARFTTWPPLEV